MGPKYFELEAMKYFMETTLSQCLISESTFRNKG